MEQTMTQRLLAEFVGAFTLVFIGAGSIVVGATQLAGAGDLVAIALAHGLAIATMVSALGHISGAHFNPAVTIGAWATQKIDAMSAAGYVVAQLAGAAAGAFVLQVSIPDVARGTLGIPLVNPSISTGQAVLIEAVLTFFLVWVIFATAIDPDGAFGKIAGLSIGVVYTMDMVMGYYWTGAAINPARWFGPAAISGEFANFWVWIVGPTAGAIIAAVLYDSVILARRGAGGSAEPGEAPHGWGAHGEDADAVSDAHEE